MTPFFFFPPQRPDVSVEHFYTSARLFTQPRCFGKAEDAFGKLILLPDGEQGVMGDEGVRQRFLLQVPPTAADELPTSRPGTASLAQCYH